MMKKLFVCICFSIMLLPALQARIEILSISPTTPAGSCTGSVEIIANGNAAPFTVFVLETGQTYYNVEGIFRIEDLCEGTYSLSVSPADLPGCTTILNPFVSSDNSATAPPDLLVNSEEEEEVEDQSNLSLPSQLTVEQANLNFSIDVYPNPTRDFVNVYIHSSEASAIYQLNFLNIVGQQIFESNTPAHELTKFNLRGLNAGVYFMEAIDANGDRLLKKVVVQ